MYLHYCLKLQSNIIARNTTYISSNNTHPFLHFAFFFVCFIRHQDIISRYENNCDNNIDFLN